jgi:methionine-rich copper-binding protein CopC
MTHRLGIPVRRLVSIIAASAAVIAVSAWTAPFHLHLVKSVPAANATVGTAPDSIRLWFSQAPELKLTSVTVTGPRTTVVPIAPLAARDSALVVAPVKGRMAAGSYTVAWRTMSKDGHVVKGTFAFTVGAANGP